MDTCVKVVVALALEIQLLIQVLLFYFFINFIYLFYFILQQNEDLANKTSSLLLFIGIF
jgi:hypothetical protein